MKLKLMIRKIKKLHKTSKAFTLIEILVVMAIISLVTSVVYANLTESRAKARDSRRVAEASEVKKALSLYQHDHGSYPVSGGVVYEKDNSASYNSAIQQLVDGGYLSAIPKDPGDNQYSYYGSEDVAIFEVDVEISDNGGGNLCSSDITLIRLIFGASTNKLDFDVTDTPILGQFGYVFVDMFDIDLNQTNQSVEQIVVRECGGDLCLGSATVASVGGGMCQVTENGLLSLSDPNFDHPVGHTDSCMNLIPTQLPLSALIDMADSNDNMCAGSKNCFCSY